MQTAVAQNRLSVLESRSSDDAPVFFVFIEPAIIAIDQDAFSSIIGQEAPHYAVLALLAFLSRRRQPSHMGSAQNIGHDGTWYQPAVGMIIQLGAKIDKSIEQRFRRKLFVFFLHVPAAVRSYVSSGLYLHGAKALPNVIGDNDVSIRHARWCERRDIPASQQLTHDVVLASRAQDRGIRSSHFHAISPRLDFLSAHIPENLILGQCA